MQSVSLEHWCRDLQSVVQFADGLTARFAELVDTMPPDAGDAASLPRLAELLRRLDVRTDEPAPIATGSSSWHSGWDAMPTAYGANLGRRLLESMHSSSAGLRQAPPAGPDHSFAVPIFRPKRPVPGRWKRLVWERPLPAGDRTRFRLAGRPLAARRAAQTRIIIAMARKPAAAGAAAGGPVALRRLAVPQVGPDRRRLASHSPALPAETIARTGRSPTPTSGRGGPAPPQPTDFKSRSTRTFVTAVRRMCGSEPWPWPLGSASGR